MISTIASKMKFYIQFKPRYPINHIFTLKKNHIWTKNNSDGQGYTRSHEIKKLYFRRMIDWAGSFVVSIKLTEYPTVNQALFFLQQQQPQKKRFVVCV